MAEIPQSVSIEAVRTGRYLSKLLDEDRPQPAPTYMVELRYWDFIGVQLTAGHYDSIVFDRKQSKFDRNTPSIFSVGADAVRSTIQTQNIRYIALYDPTLKANALAMDFLHPAQEIGEWTIFVSN